MFFRSKSRFSIFGKESIDHHFHQIWISNTLGENLDNKGLVTVIVYLQYKQEFKSYQYRQKSSRSEKMVVF